MGDISLPILFFIAGIIALDQLTKFIVQGAMQPGESIPVISGIFHITYVLNAGAAFGILENQRIFFLATAMLLVAAAAFFWRKIASERLVTRLGTAMLLGGAVGNMIDRVRTGYVVDFFDFRVWPVFNIADIFIVVGVGAIIYMMVFSKPKER